MIGYVCKYTPVEVFAGFGEEVVRISPNESTGAGDHIHPNICGYAKSVLQAAKKGGYSAVVLTGCCDSLKRVADALREGGVRVYVLSLPRMAGEGAAALFAGSIKKLMEAYARDTEISFDMERFTTALRQNMENDALPVEKHIALMGARAPQWLLNACRKNCALPVYDYTCARREPLPAGEAAGESFEWYARQLLEQSPCMRMWDVSKRAALSGEENIRGIIYHTIKFCDFYGFEYAGLKTDVPLLKIETNYEPFAAGQLSTNLQAFYENGGWYVADEGAEDFEDTMDDREESGRNWYFAGIDSGSASTKVVILEESGAVASHAVVPTGAKSQESAIAAFEQALRNAGIPRGSVKRIVATGYGRHAIDWAHKNITEISCHAKGAYRLYPQARTVIDIGGQDSKVIQMDESGNVTDFTMNDKCAAGTGKFLELMAHTLQTDLENMARQGLAWKENIAISSMCAVFAESEVISLIAQNKEKEDIIHGLNDSIAGRVCASVLRQNAQGAFVMTGGVAKNRGVVREIEKRVGEGLLLPEQPQICGALGAALFAIQI